MLTKDENLALLCALDKVIKPKLDDAKQDAKYQLMESFEATGADRKAILVDGTKVGEVGMSYSTAKPVPKIGYESDFLDYLESLGLTERTPKKGWEKQFSRAGDAVIHSNSGEIADCMEWEPSRVKTAAVRGCKPEEVLNALSGKLQGTNPFALLTEE